MVRRIAVDLTSVNTSITPSSNVTFDLGTANNAWRDLFLSGNTITLGGATISTDTNTGSITMIPKVTEANPNPKATLIKADGVASVNTAGGVVSSNSIVSSSPQAPITVYATLAELPLSSVASGAMALVSETNRLYIWSTSGWYNIAILNQSPTISAGAANSYTKNILSSNTVITLTATDPEGLPLTYSYSVTSGSLQDTTITQANNVFTVTPGNTVTSFGISFTASDGVNISSSSSTFNIINNPPVFTTSPDSVYSLESDGTPTVITLAATDEEGQPITWSYSVTSGSLGGTTVTQSNNIFTITPSTNSADAGDFSITFTVSDGVNNTSAVSSFSLVFGPTWNNPIYVRQLQSEANSYFGAQVSMTNEYIVVGAPRRLNNTGQVRFFHTANGAYIGLVNGTTSGSAFGNALAIANNKVAISQPSSGIGGSVLIYTLSTRTLERTINNPEAGLAPGAGDNFGVSIATDGNYLIVGASGEDTADGTNAGMAFVYNINTGSLIRTFTNPNAVENANNDGFGSGVGVYGDLAIIGASGESFNGAQGVGAAHAFSISTGELLHTWINPLEYGWWFSAFGEKIKITENKIFITAKGYWASANGTADAYSGAIFIYDKSTYEFIRRIDNPSIYGLNNSDYFGGSLDIYDKYLIVGASGEDSASDSGTGYAFIYNINTGALLSTLTNPNANGTPTADGFGGSVAITNGYAVVGAPGEYLNDPNRGGAAYLFEPGLPT